MERRIGPFFAVLIRSRAARLEGVHGGAAWALGAIGLMWAGCT